MPRAIMALPPLRYPSRSLSTCHGDMNSISKFGKSEPASGSRCGKPEHHDSDDDDGLGHSVTDRMPHGP
jgi:hypothetical protein